MSKSVWHALGLAALQSGAVLALQEAEACHSGNLMLVREMAGECIDQCQSSCPAVNAAIGAYLGGGEPAALNSVCGAAEAFQCFVQPEHFSACSHFYGEAAKFGFHLPKSAEEIHSTCQRQAQVTSMLGVGGSLQSMSKLATKDTLSGPVVAPSPQILTAEVGNTSPCQTGNVGLVYRMAQPCFDQCQDSCPAVDDAITAYLIGGGKDAALAAVCEQSKAFECFLEDAHIGNCSVFFTQASSFGITLPTNMDELNTTCTSSHLSEMVAVAAGRGLSAKGHEGVIDGGEERDDEDQNEGEAVAVNAEEEHDGVLEKGEGEDREHDEDQNEGESVAASAEEEHDGVLEKGEGEDRQHDEEDHEEDEEAAGRGLSAKGHEGVIDGGEERDDEDQNEGEAVAANAEEEHDGVLEKGEREDQEHDEENEELEAEGTSNVKPLLASALQGQVHSEASACSHGTVKMIYDMAPDCFNQCMSSCSAVGHAVTAYLTRGGQPAAIRSICHDKSSFACFVEPDHIGACGVFFTQARRYGFTLPANMHELDSHCHRRLRGASPDVAAVATGAPAQAGGGSTSP